MKRARLGDEEGTDAGEERTSSGIRRSSGRTGDAVQLPATTESSVTLQTSGADSGEDNEDDDEYDDDDEEDSIWRDDAEEDSKPWGFVVYRTTYSDEAKWQAFREVLDGFVKGASESIKSEAANPRAVVLNFIEDEPKLKVLPPSMSGSAYALLCSKICLILGRCILNKIF